MKTTERFTNAVTKLYNAFHSKTLDATICQKCAVGNMCNNSPDWAGLKIRNSICYHDYDLALSVIAKTGYSELEIANIESIFMKGCRKGDKNIKWNPSQVHSEINNDLVFKALCAVVEYLCELDGIPNVMDYTCLFETENNAPKHELNLVNV